MIGLHYSPEGKTVGGLLGDTTPAKALSNIATRGCFYTTALPVYRAGQTSGQIVSGGME